MTPEESIAHFNTIWEGGYFEGDPLDPMAPSSYAQFGYNSVLYTTYLVCIKPYVNADTTVIEIGPGRGAWTNTFVRQKAKRIFALDAAPPERTEFWTHVGRRPEITYITVKDFSLSDVPDDSADYFFSFGVFCHLDKELAKEYLRNLFRKLTSGANGFLMVGDYDKYNSLCQRQQRFSVFDRLLDIRRRRLALVRGAMRLATAIPGLRNTLTPLDRSTPLRTGHSFRDFPIDELSDYLARIGFVVVEKDVGVNHRDPVTHFRKP